MKAIYRLIIAIALAAIAGAVVYAVVKAHTRKDPLTIEPAKVADVRSVVELCSVDFYNEVPVKDTVNNKAIFAIQKQQGSISFNVENLKADVREDTVFVELPKEKITLYESTDDNSYEVIDTKGLSLFTSSKLTNEEDNIVKNRLRRNSLRRLYSSGTVARARKEGKQNLSVLLEQIYRRPVVVSDPPAVVATKK